MGVSIVVADDETNITDVCRRYLEREGYKVWVASNGEEALSLWEKHCPDLLILDLMMPRVDGWDVCNTVRQTEDTPIILLTARGEEPDRLLGLTMGADDYITKPFSPRELVLRVKNILRRTQAISGKTSDSSDQAALLQRGNKTNETHRDSQSEMHFNGLSIFRDERRVVVNDSEVELTAKEFDLLYLLASFPGKVFSRSHLLNQIWDMAYDGDTTTVTVHIRRLREKVEQAPSEPKWIKTVWGIGYKLDMNGGTLP